MVNDYKSGLGFALGRFNYLNIYFKSDNYTLNYESHNIENETPSHLT